MKTVLDYIQLLETEGATNTISSGAIATKEVPIGKVEKRKTAEESVLTVTTTGVDPLAKVHAPETPESLGGQTDQDADEHKKHMFKQKQQYQIDQLSSH